MGLDGERRARRGADRTAEQNVIGEYDIRRQEVSDRGGVGLDPGVELRAAQSCTRPHSQPLVAVEDEHGQQSADVRREAVALPRSKRSGLASWERRVTSRPALLHSRASMRV